MNARRWSADVMELGDRIAALTVGDAALLHRYLDEVYGIRAPDFMAIRPEPKPDPQPPVPVQTVFAVRLDSYEPASKLAVIRAYRELTGRGLKESLELVGQAPCVVRQDLDRAEAERTKAVLEGAGARVSLV
jgi:large subunit ribosomal protein L7/L12